MPRLTILGHGHQGTRYAAAARELDWTESPIDSYPDFAVCCWPPHRHQEAFALCLAHQVALLTEKPTAPALAAALGMYGMAASRGLPFATAFVHLHNPRLFRLRPAASGTITWTGPHSAYDAPGMPQLTCPASLEWGSHAWAMAHYLGIDPENVVTGWSDERDTVVRTDRGEYGGEWSPDQNPLRLLLQDFLEWVNGGEDERFSPELGIHVARMCHGHRDPVFVGDGEAVG